eukprot:GHVR01063059.1.p1 GENE.GHVR01063059.1~~GHVR01063059.1.p1  ORF type:complete len:193 (-),score=32.40 GHVR01063059.1:71-649(-)
MQLRQHNEERYVAKEEFYKNKWENIRSAQQKNSHLRNRDRATRYATRTALVQNRSHEAKAVKDASHQSLVQRREREIFEQKLNTERTTLVRKQKEEAKRRQHSEQLAKLEAYRHQYESRVATEEMLRSRTESLVSRMEKEEMELIQRLQNTQLVQRNAYEELEGALGTTSQTLPSVVRTKNRIQPRSTTQNS